MNKQIALVTCYFQPNYGSQLQAYATQMAFDKLGVSNVTICIDGLHKEIRNRKLKYFFSRITDIHTVKDKMATVRKVLAKKLYPEYAAHLSERTRKFKEFEDNFHLSEKYNSFADLSQHCMDYAAFVVGSDQLWLPSNITADYYTLNFVPNGVKKISLATSFGVSELPKKQAAMARAFLPHLDAVSVREESGKKLIERLTGVKAEVICDPTILFAGKEWQQFTNHERYVKDKYLFVYFLGNNPEHRELVRRFREQTGYKIVQLQHCDEYIASDEGFPDDTPWSVGPLEFIQLIRDAEYVFTDSFHCSVFSMLQHKSFFTFRRYKSDGTVSTNGRIYSLLHLTGLTDHLLTGSEDVMKLLAKSIDYKAVDEQLEKSRAFSWEWIKESIKL